jgi:uncharacterized protein YqhQ
MSPSGERPYVGGQAVIEGVMMRSPRSLAVAVRRPDGSIVVRADGWVSLWERLTFLRAPLCRGAVVLLESLHNGLAALAFAAEQAEQAEPETADAAREGDGGRRVGRDVGTGLTLLISLALAMGLFVGLPHLLAWGVGRASGLGADVDRFGFHALDGLFKLGIFVGYIAAISRIPEIRRVFEYHGAEHKVVNVYENGLPLTLENARRFTTFHARCGTSFMLFVLVLSIFLFAAVFPLVPPVSSVTLVNHVAMIGLKIPLMIPLAGLAYEINRYAARRPDRLWVQAMVVPGRLMQRLTTREPSDDQLEIALAAMQAALQREAALEPMDARAARAAVRAEALGPRIAVFRDYREAVVALCAAPVPALESRL